MHKLLYKGKKRRSHFWKQKICYSTEGKETEASEQPEEERRWFFGLPFF